MPEALCRPANAVEKHPLIFRENKKARTIKSAPGKYQPQDYQSTMCKV
jgi:hypothetical protein